jgi:hypothetical protein
VWAAKARTRPRGGLSQPWRKSWIVLTPYPSVRSPQTITETVMLLRALLVPPRQASRSAPLVARLVQAARHPRAGCTRVSGATRAHRELPDVSSPLFAGVRLSRPARNEREPGRSRPGTADDLRCRRSAAGPAGRRRSRLLHRVPVVDDVQDDEADERADVDEHGPTGKQRPGRRRREPKISRSSRIAARRRANCTNEHYTTQAHAGEPPPGSP